LQWRHSSSNTLAGFEPTCLVNCRQIREEAIQIKLKHVVREQTNILTQFRSLNPVEDKEEREEKTLRLRHLKLEEDRVC
jgi:hypothetical protein